MSKQLYVEINNSQKSKLKKNAFEKVNLQQESKKDPKYKTEMCKSWETKGFCVYGNKCRFAHGREELFDKSNSNNNYKQKHCTSFYKLGNCLYGFRCHFKHHDNDIKEIERSYYSYLLDIFHLNNENYFLNNIVSDKTCFNCPDFNLFKIGNFSNSSKTHSRSLSTTSNDSYLQSHHQGKNSFTRRLNVFNNIISKSSSKSMNDNEDSFDFQSNAVIFCQTLVSSI